MLKTIASNTIAQLVAKFFGAGLTLITTYFTIRIAGLDLYGDLTKILVLVAVGFTAIDFGLNAEAIRSSDSPISLKNSLTSTLFARILLSLIAILVLNLIILFLPGGYSPAIKNIFWLGSISIVLQGIYTSGNVYFQYHLSYWRSTVSVVVGSLVGTLLTLYYLRFSPTLPHLVLATTTGYFVMAISTLLLLPSLSVSNLNLRSIFHTLRRSLLLGSILILSVLSSKIDTVLLGIFRSSSEVGQYGFAYRIFDVILVLPAFAMNAIYPLLVKQSSHSKSRQLVNQTVLVMGALSLVVAALTYYLSPYLSLVKSNLDLSITSLRYLTLALPFFYVTSPLMWSLISQKRDRQVIITYALALVFNATLNFILIPRYGAPAAAITTGATEILIFFSLLYFSRI